MGHTHSREAPEEQHLYTEPRWEHALQALPDSERDVMTGGRPGALTC